MHTASNTNQVPTKLLKSLTQTRCVCTDIDTEEGSVSIHLNLKEQNKNKQITLQSSKSSSDGISLSAEKGPKFMCCRLAVPRFIIEFSKPRGSSIIAHARFCFKTWPHDAPIKLVFLLLLIIAFQRLFFPSHNL